MIADDCLELILHLTSSASEFILSKIDKKMFKISSEIIHKTFLMHTHNDELKKPSIRTHSD